MTKCIHFACGFPVRFRLIVNRFNIFFNSSHIILIFIDSNPKISKEIQYGCEVLEWIMISKTSLRDNESFIQHRPCFFVEKGFFFFFFFFFLMQSNTLNFFYVYIYCVKFINKNHFSTKQKYKF